MPQFTQLNLEGRASRSTNSAVHSAYAVSNKKNVILGGLLMVTSLLGGLLLVLSACSKKAAVNSGSQNTQISQAVPDTPSVAPTAAPVASQPVAPKKVVKKRPATVTYTDKVNGVSFRYPRRYALKTGDALQKDAAAQGAVQMNFVQPGGTTLAAVETPKNLYPGTDFNSGFFRVSVNQNLKAEECEQFAFPTTTHPENEPGSPAKATVGGTEFKQVEDFGPTKPADARYYHVYQNGACYEFALGMQTAEETKEGVKPVDRELVFHQLEKILASAKIKPEAVPTVATGAPTPAAPVATAPAATVPATPAAQEAAVK